MTFPYILIDTENFSIVFNEFRDKNSKRGETMGLITAKALLEKKLNKKVCQI